MRILVTAGNTLVPIDQVRCITNIFTGRTGAQIAISALERGHYVHLLTSHPEVADQLLYNNLIPGEEWEIDSYKSFNDLQVAMKKAITSDNLDAVVHCAAVSDYQCAGVYAPGAETSFDAKANIWESGSSSKPSLQHVSAGKVKSDAEELWLRLVRTPKIVDRIRSDWGFQGVLVKFKLEVDIDDEELLRRAEESRVQSSADLMVANTLEGSKSWALMGPVDGAYLRLDRQNLAVRLLEQIERIHSG